MIRDDLVSRLMAYGLLLPEYSDTPFYPSTQDSPQITFFGGEMGKMPIHEFSVWDECRKAVNKFKKVRAAIFDL